jgi:tetratricopeptide (TPR) repeat protein
LQPGFFSRTVISDIMHRMSRRLFVVVLALLCFAHPAQACLWDYDTLRDEKRGMPGIAEVLAGQWERHSRFFYENRVVKMKSLLATRPDDQDAIDNLAVAYFKLGKSDAAIATMLDKEKRFPDRYTTSSNLGTFYMLNGDLDGAIACLKKALVINPNAHFGREEYQLTLAEHLKKAEVDPTVLDESFIYDIFYPTGITTQPTTDSSDIEQMMEGDFVIDRASGNPGKLADMGFKPNIIQGVVGMLRFGTDQSPDLFYALGDLLAFHGDKNLAVRAYQRALDLKYSRLYAVKKAIEQVKELEVPRGGLDPAVIAAERADAAAWVADYQQFEDDLVQSGKNTDDEALYAPFYATHGRGLKTNDVFIGDYANESILQKFPLPTIAAILFIAAGAVFVLRVLRRLLFWKSAG